MPLTLDRQLALMRDDLSLFSEHCVSQMDQVVQHLINGEMDSLKAIQTNQHQMYRLAVKVEEDCLNTLALYQPVASDFTWIILIIKINNELDRMNDQIYLLAEKINNFSEDQTIIIHATERMAIKLLQAMKVIHQNLFTADVGNLKNADCLNCEILEQHLEHQKYIEKIMSLDLEHAESHLINWSMVKIIRDICVHLVRIVELVGEMPPIKQT